MSDVGCLNAAFSVKQQKSGFLFQLDGMAFLADFRKNRSG
jgi:hypothetical protein